MDYHILVKKVRKSDLAVIMTCAHLTFNQIILCFRNTQAMSQRFSI